MGHTESDLIQHVARRVRITRMFLKLSLEESASFLGIPLWLLYNKENGLASFTYQDFIDMERLYNLSWLIFFQDFSKKDKPEKTAMLFDGDHNVVSRHSGAKLHEIITYFGLGTNAPSEENSDLDMLNYRMGALAVPEPAFAMSDR